MSATLQRKMFRLARKTEFFAEKGLTTQIGHGKSWWPIALVKELIDNSLDACETAGVAPSIVADVRSDAVTVTDNGSGIDPETVKHALDFNVRVSDKVGYIAPTRGQQGNAIKTFIAASFVANGEEGLVEVAAHGVLHRISVSFDHIAGEPRIDHTTGPSEVRTGTSITVRFDDVASYLTGEETRGYYQPPPTIWELLNNYAAFNPHTTFTCRVDGDEISIQATDTSWRKWSPTTPTSPHWYTPENLRDLIAYVISAERGNGGSCTVRDFVRTFNGLKGTANAKKVSDAAGLANARLEDLIVDQNLDIEKIRALRRAMQDIARPVKPAKLGVIGKQCLTEHLVQVREVDADRVRYRSKKGECDGRPFVVEAAFAVRSDCEHEREVVTGINWSPTLTNPFDVDLWNPLDKAFVDAGDPVVVLVHLATPRVVFTDRGKASARVGPEVREAIDSTIGTVTREFTKLKKKMRREEKAEQREYEQAYCARRSRYTTKDACYDVLPEAYVAAAGSVGFAEQRQVMYATRKLVLTEGVEWYKNDSSFIQSVLPAFMKDHPELTKDWEIYADKRGHLIEPHTGRTIGLGHREVRSYFSRWHTADVEGSASPSLGGVKTCGPSDRFRHVLFIEKEGFGPLFDAVNLRARYDLAIMSTKGMSNTAARELVDRLSQAGVTVFTLHDFDKSGFGIAYTLGHDTDRYQFVRRPNVIDLGIRLDDILSLGLEGEPVKYKTEKDPAEDLQEKGATNDEIEFLVEGGYASRWYGRRVELNELGNDALIDLIEKKLQAQGVEKVVPAQDKLVETYRQLSRLRAAEEAAAKVLEHFEPCRVAVPDHLEDRIRDRLGQNPAMCWDDALSEILDEQEEDDDR